MSQILLPDSAVESITFQEFLILLTQLLDARANPPVNTWLNASHGVIPVNCQIGADAANDLNMIQRRIQDDLNMVAMKYRVYGFMWHSPA